MKPRNAQNIARRPRRRRGAFTLLELMLGMLVTALVMTALAALLGAVSQGWQQSGDAQAQSNVVVQTHVRMQRLLKGVRQIGAYRGGSIDGTAVEQAAALLWTQDANGDYQIQLSEMALLEAEMSGEVQNCTIKYYTLAYPANWTVEQKNTEDGTAVTDAELYDAASIDWFRSIVQGSPYGRATVVARNVVGSEFRKTDGTAVTRPTFNYLLNIQRGDAPETEYGSVTVRTPTTLPAGQNGA
jgi:type II secretory pathway component PulJ